MLMQTWPFWVRNYLMLQMHMSFARTEIQELDVHIQATKEALEKTTLAR